MKFAQVIIDISLKGLDRPFSYRIPLSLEGRLRAGSIVMCPFGAGNTLRKGYVVGFSDSAGVAPEKLKEISEVVEPSRGYSMEKDSEFSVRLAAWMKNRYGSTMAASMRTVLVSRKSGKIKEQRQLRLAVSVQEGQRLLALCEKKHQTARVRLIKELLATPVLPWNLVTTQLHVTSTVIRGLEKSGVLKIEYVRELRNPVVNIAGSDRTGMELSHEQRRIVEAVVGDFDRIHSRGENDPPANGSDPAGAGGSFSSEEPFVSLIHGVTGSGKTEVYITIIKEICKRGRQAVMLIPEISLTYQTLMRFYSHFGDRVSVINSSLSDAERADQWERARSGKIDVIIGPRSALFTPFPQIGVIVIDEEHENSYKNESMPKYQTREVAEEIARMHGAVLVLGSATPSLESYWRAQKGEIRLFPLKNRITGARLPSVETVDMREELQQGNKSILSRSLYRKLEDRLRRGEQSILFLNRRGFAGFVSCRNCGSVPTCPHCDVSLSLHGNGRLMCHYCGYERAAFRTCPVCGSRLVFPMRAGTEKIEGYLREIFPEARILRMDADTTKKKGSYERILSAFSSEEADILLGTQMIVKGHDFPSVTLVGILMADLSLYGEDYRAAERTFQLLTQAAGRAGRGKKGGDVVIQSYQPGHYAIRHAANQDYEGFYAEEIAYRRLMRYPPAAHMMAVQIQSEEEEKAMRAAGEIRMALTGRGGPAPKDFQIIGPAEASLKRLRDLFRFVLYIKSEKYDTLISCREAVERLVFPADASRGDKPGLFRGVEIQFDFDPMNPF